MRRIASAISAVALLLSLLSVTAFAKPVTLTMIVDSRPTYQAWQKRVIAEFEKEHPNVTVQTIQAAGSVSEQQLTMLLAGVPFDLGYADPHTITAWGRQGMLVDLASNVEKAHEQFSDWYPSALDLYRVRGGVYGLPIDIQLGGIFYNADAFQEAGLAFPEQDWTYADLRDDARRLLIRNAEGGVSRHGFKIPTWRNWVTAIWSFGGDFVDDWNDPKAFTGHASGTIAALEYLNDLVVTEAVQDRETHRRVGATAAFTEGHVAMVQTNTIALYQFQDIADFEWDVAALPTGPAEQSTMINAIGWFIPQVSEHQAEAWQLLRKLTSSESLEMLVEMVQTVPPSRSVIMSSWLPSVDMPRNKAIVLQGVEKARAPGTLPAELYNPISEISHAAIWGDIPAASAVENMERLIEALLETMGE